MLNLYTDKRDDGQNSMSFACEFEIDLTYDSNANVNTLDNLDINTNDFSIIVMRFMAPGEFNGSIDSYMIKRLGQEKFNSIKNNKNIWLMILDIYDETKCITQQLPNTANEQVNSLSSRTILVNSSRDDTNPYGFFKFKYTVPYWIKLLHVEFDNKVWNQSLFVTGHDLELKNKLMLCLMNNSRMPRNMFYRLVEDNSNLKNNSLISFVSQGIRLDNDVETVITMGSDRYQNPNWYQSTMFSVVFETTWYNDFFTEKIFKPILNEHPIIVLQNKSYIEYLKDLGIDLTNEDFLNTNYGITSEKMSNETSIMVNKLYNKVLTYSSMDKKNLYDKLYNNELVDIRKQNKSKLLDKDYCVQQMNKYVYTMTETIKKVYNEHK
tara:strand:+ start:164 stop:1300 length:1137 start_codon:yes stop_codon:yes gene_type:complete